MLKTKLIFTLGPATDQAGVLPALIKSGMDGARFNFSHGTHAEHQTRFQRLKAEARKQGKTIACLIDLTGPKIRVGRFPRGAIELSAGQKITLIPGKGLGTSRLVPISCSGLAQAVSKGKMILLDDGIIRLEVIASRPGKGIVCQVKVGGILKDHKGVNLPGVPIRLPAITRKDMQDLQFGLKLGMDYVALSFVRTPQALKQLRELVKRQGSSARIIAKIEKPEAIQHLDEIIRESDGILIARGDLGVEMDPEKVPVLQKKIITRSNQQGRFVITATQMLQSMVTNPTPTRAEASDVANAIFDGTDALMLSGETAAGQYPGEAAAMLATIAREAEKFPGYNRLSEDLKVSELAEEVVVAGVHLADRTQAAGLVVFTHTGNIVRLIARHRPQVPVLALAHDAAVQRRIQLFWGIQSSLIQKRVAMEAIVQQAEINLLKNKLLPKGSLVVILASSSTNNQANFIKLHRLGS